eukprot:gb/GEZN01009478.1/.p1 GENE.gb/GEZN01009478.1/~~gb/GEZN01009478.1/.p1  ORF type:complete len:327 (+),score=48.71 gb/GEZN01009478.1/:86-1066(+)
MTSPVVAALAASPLKRAKLEEWGRVALVTGANKGIGFEIAKSLLKQAENENLAVLLGSRDITRGKKALEELRALHKDKSKRVHLVVIDIDDQKSVDEALQHITKEFGRLDILINNAGRAWKGDAFDKTVAETTIATNYYGTLRTTNAFLPLLRKSPYGRVVNVSSGSGSNSLRRMSEPLRKAFLADDLTMEGLSKLMNQFVKDVDEGKSDERGWPHNTYGTSKAGLSMQTRIQARDEAKALKNKLKGEGNTTATKDQAKTDKEQKGMLLINACCPGWCRTDMAGPSAPKTAAQGAETPVLLALLPPSSTVTGTWWKEGKQCSSWLD